MKNIPDSSGFSSQNKKFKTTIVYLAHHSLPACKSFQSCPTLRDPMNCSLPGSSIHGISQARILQLDLPKPGIKPTSFLSSALAGGFFTSSTTWEASPLLRVGNSGWDQPSSSSPSLSMDNSCLCNQTWRCKFDPWVGKFPWSRKWQPTPVFLPGEFHGHRSLAGYSPWGHKESDTTEQLTLSLAS